MDDKQWRLKQIEIRIAEINSNITNIEQWPFNRRREKIKSYQKELEILSRISEKIKQEPDSQENTRIHFRQI